MKRKIIWVVTIVVCIALVFPLLGGCKAAPTTPTPEKPIAWKFANYGGMVSPWNYLPAWFFEQLEKRTAGRMTVEMHVGASLIGAKEQPDGLKSGLMEATTIVASYYPAKFPLTECITLPFVLPASASRKGIRDTFLTHKFFNQQPALIEEFANWNAMFLLPHGLTQYNMMGNKPMRTVDDLKGKKIRALGPLGEVLKEFGAVPVFTTAPEAYESLQKGTIDLFSHAGYFFAAYKCHEVSKYWIDGMFMGSFMSPVVISITAFNALPADIQGIIMELAEEAVLHFADEYYMKEAEGRRIYKEAGLDMYMFPPEERAKMVKVAEEITWDLWIAKMEEKGLPGREILAATLAEIERLAKAE